LHLAILTYHTLKRRECRALLIGRVLVAFVVFKRGIRTRIRINFQPAVLLLCLSQPWLAFGQVSLLNSAPSRVVIVRDPGATDAFQPQLERIRGMISRGLTNLTRKDSVSAAWRSLLSTQDIVGLKVYSGPGATSGTRPAVVSAVIESLLESGIPTNHIIVWDKWAADLRNSGFVELGGRYGVAVAASSAAGYDPKTFYESPFLGHLLFGDFEFGKTENGGRKSFVSKLLTSRLTKIINITPLLNHHSAGVCGNLFSLTMGSVDNTFRFENEPRQLASAVPEIYALREVGDRVALNIVDALICQYQGEQTLLLHYSTVLNELRFSKDPVALDVLSLQELERQRRAAGMLVRTNSLELFQNASLLELGVSELSKIQVEPIR
jgi:hypothetical protein